jgi:hypothetical protein
MDLPMAMRWGEKCIEEFRDQARKEKELGLPVTAFMTDLDDELNQMRLQLNFVTNIVEPLWSALVACLPRLSTVLEDGRSVLHNISNNRAYYMSRVQQLSEKPSLPSDDVKRN